MGGQGGARERACAFGGRLDQRGRHGQVAVEVEFALAVPHRREKELCVRCSGGPHGLLLRAYHGCAALEGFADGNRTPFRGIRGRFDAPPDQSDRRLRLPRGRTSRCSEGTTGASNTRENRLRARKLVPPDRTLVRRPTFPHTATNGMSSKPGPGGGGPFAPPSAAAARPDIATATPDRMRTNPAASVMRSFSFRMVVEKTPNATSPQSSASTLSCGARKGPPNALLPMRLAGTWKQYSPPAMSQEKKMARGSVHSCALGRVSTKKTYPRKRVPVNRTDGQRAERPGPRRERTFILSCRYQATVMKLLERTSRKTQSAPREL